jgi:hypothetical protein
MIWNPIVQLESTLTLALTRRCEKQKNLALKIFTMRSLSWAHPPLGRHIPRYCVMIDCQKRTGRPQTTGPYRERLWWLLPEMRMVGQREVRSNGMRSFWVNWRDGWPRDVDARRIGPSHAPLNCQNNSGATPQTSPVVCAAL